MEKTIADIIAEIKETISVLSERVAALEACLPAGDVPETETLPAEDMPEAEAFAAEETVDIVEPLDIIDVFPASEPSLAAAPAEERVPEPEPVVPEPAVFEPAPAEPVEGLGAINDIAAAKVKEAINDAYAADYAWKTDIPGSELRNILSGISLNDRILFINTLFGGDPESFQSTIAYLNEASSFAEATDYLSGRFPDWKLGSDTVYRFMMAVRRHLRS